MDKPKTPDAAEIRRRKCAWAMCLGVTLMTAFMYKAKIGPEEFFPKETVWAQSDSQFLALLSLGALCGIVLAFTASFIASFTIVSGKGPPSVLAAIGWLASPLPIIMAIVILPSMPHLIIGSVIALGVAGCCYPLLRQAK